MQKMIVTKADILKNGIWLTFPPLICGCYANGLGLLGEKLYFTKRLRYRPIFYIVPAVIFAIAHTTHAVIYHQRSF
jgi:hypothetical protein